MSEQQMTQKDLVRLTGCPPYIVRYFKECGYLKVERDSQGPGDPVLYHPDSVRIIQERRQNKRTPEIGQV